MKTISIKSERFILRELKVSDANDRYLSWVNNLGVAQYIDYAKQKNEMKDLRSYIRDKSNKENILLLGIFTREGGEHIGNIKYEPIDCQNKYAVMGILIGEEEWRGKGVAPEVIIESSMWLSRKRGVRQIMLNVDVGNAGAIRAYRKVGFIFQDTQYISTSDQTMLTMVWDIW